MRDWSPGPALSRYAVRASTACTSRKSSASAPGTVAARQVSPPSVVRKNVPFVPLAQTMLSLTTLSPRRLAVVLLVWGVHCAYATVAKKMISADDADSAERRGASRVHVT